MELNNLYKKEMFKKISLIKERNFLLKNRNKLQFGGTELNNISNNISNNIIPKKFAPDNISDDIVPIKNVINIDKAIEQNNIAINGYLNQLDKLHTIITKETPNIPSEKLDELVEKLNLDKDLIISQQEKIKDTQTTSNKYPQMIDKIQEENKTLGEINVKLVQKSATDEETNDQLRMENVEYKTKITKMEQLAEQLKNLEEQYKTCQSNEEKCKENMVQNFQKYDNELINYVENQESPQTGGGQIGGRQLSYNLYINKKIYNRNKKNLLDNYNKFLTIKQSIIKKNIDSIIKKKKIKISHIKKELKYLFNNREKYMKSQQVFIGGEISKPETYNKLVSNLIDNKQLPDEHFQNIYNKLKNVMKGDCPLSSSSDKSILDMVYLAVLGKTQEELSPSEQNFLNKATTIKQLGDEIIALLSDCEPFEYDKKFESEINDIMNKTKVLDKLSNLINNNEDPIIFQKTIDYLSVDAPPSLNLTGDAKNMMTEVYNFYSQKIKIHTDNLPSMLSDLKLTMDENWESDEDIKKILCKKIGVLQKTLKNIARELDLSYIINKYEDISGAVRIYVRINDYAVKKDEMDKYQCSADSVCLGRSYAIEKDADGKETTFILSRNACEHDAFFSSENRAKSIKEKENIFNIIDTDLLEKYNMSNVHKFGSFFGTYENVTNKDIFEGVKGKSNNPPLKDALLQAIDGYSIVLFGYGYSGSGKSYTLLNGENSMLRSFMSEAKAVGVDITISKISELYGRFRIQKQQMEANEYEITEEQLQNLNSQINFNNINNTDKKVREKQIDILLSTVENFRRTSRRNSQGVRIPATIKGTPNNPASSRSHLFIRFSVKTKKGPKGYITFVDMAGIEDPVEIAINIFPFNDLRNLINPFKDPSNELKGSPWAKLNLKEFKNSSIAQEKLLNYFHKVCLDLQRAEREICSKKRRDYTNESNLDWKWIRECNDGSNIRYEDSVSGKTINGYPENIFFKLPIPVPPDSYKNRGEKKNFEREEDRRRTINKTVPSWKKIRDNTAEKEKIMKNIQSKLLTKGEAFAFLSELKEVFYYTLGDCSESNKIKRIDEVIDRWILNLNKDGEPWRYISNLKNLWINHPQRQGNDFERKCTEIYILLTNYCFGCMILNGIVQDYSDIESGFIAYENGTKKYLKGFLEGIKISETEYIELVEEGIFINETINHLAYYFKQKNNPKTILDENDQLKELLNRFDATEVLPRSYKKKGTTEFSERNRWDPTIFMSLKTYLPSKFLFNPHGKNINDINDYSKHVLIKKLLKELDALSQKGKPSKFIMMCLLRPEIDAKYCTGARATLAFAESVCSTCT